MFSKELESKASKFMSFILRHSPQEIGLILDSNGWVSVNSLIELANSSGKTNIVFTRELINYIVVNNDKQRFDLSEDGSKIRANQGHSVSVNLALNYVTPPDVLYHGTATRFLPSILKEGLKPMARHDVHLSFSEEVAKSVGIRHGSPTILLIDSKKMYEDGYKFQCSKNNVWLTENVPVKYIKKI